MCLRGICELSICVAFRNSYIRIGCTMASWYTGIPCHDSSIADIEVQMLLWYFFWLNILGKFLLCSPVCVPQIPELYQCMNINSLWLSLLCTVLSPHFHTFEKNLQYSMKACPLCASDCAVHFLTSLARRVVWNKKYLHCTMSYSNPVLHNLTCNTFRLLP